MRSLVLLAVSLVGTSAQCANKEWGQCGGKEWTGPTCCPSYDTCKKVNDYYSQCMPHGICLNPMYAQCGGFDHHQPPRPWTPANHHQTCCPPSFDCKFQSKYYSQCVFNATNSSCATEYQQCGGQGWKGPTCCIPGFKCTPDPKSPKYYSQCKPLPICTNARYGQCGGIDADGHPWTKQYGHDDCCPDGFACQEKNKYYSQCVMANATVPLKSRAAVAWTRSITAAVGTATRKSNGAAPTTALGDYEDVGLQCVSEFNWNQGEGSSYRSATGYFLGKGASIETNEIPDCAGGWSANDDTLILKGAKQPRMFLRDATNKLIMLDMKSEEISWTQNVAQLGRQFNGALYTTWVRPQDETDPATAARLYCDANDGTGNNLWCPEMDLGESNLCGFRSTSHPVTDLNGDAWRTSAVNCHLPLAAEVGSWYNKTSGKFVPNADYTNLFYCGLGKPTAQKMEASRPKQTWVDHFGNALYMASEQVYPGCSTASDTKCNYGLDLAGAGSINTRNDYDVHVSFDWDSTDGYLKGFSTTLTQGGNSVALPRVSTPNQAEVPIKGGFPADGRVALLVQLWTSQGRGMSWLSGANCNSTNGETPGLPSIEDTTYTIKNLRIKNTATGEEKKIKFKTVA